jgi:hypothetical protein
MARMKTAEDAGDAEIWWHKGPFASSAAADSLRMTKDQGRVRTVW